MIISLFINLMIIFSINDLVYKMSEAQVNIVFRQLVGPNQ